jgi:hypothetical protein
VTFNVVGNTLHMTTPTGQSYVAVFGGPAVAIMGDPGGTVASVRKSGPATIVETDRRAGKVVSVTTMTVRPDGKMAFTSIDPLHGTKISYLAVRQ